MQKKMIQAEVNLSPLLKGNKINQRIEYFSSRTHIGRQAFDMKLLGVQY